MPPEDGRRKPGKKKDEVTDHKIEDFAINLVANSNSEERAVLLSGQQYGTPAYRAIVGYVKKHLRRQEILAMMLHIEDEDIYHDLAKIVD